MIKIRKFKRVTIIFTEDTRILEST